MTEINTAPVKTVTSFVVACRNFFGQKPGQSLPEFAAELRTLSPKDRNDLIEMFSEVGIDATKTI